ncbi:GNAT family N-acetyltransferase [Halobacillus sp. ACCC02827]|uniref:GNAT family N-acetyltransferase n=1 Tax=Bacillaceae TaxID=186817 RepID=UPI0002A4F4A1|nr:MULTISPECIES: GNAT family N-acetyltransferase [Bacillaceae]ELK45018.1 GNAT family acetyltransferase [Halobacillus sp. BAB-2008]QHT46531.1 GNAT family N-acetyltransferase [Bacillus sp. SB49]WJE17345.1 GNAT family N-acetyltransferase [Halobacillus sp. ACCC02827]
MEVKSARLKLFPVTLDLAQTLMKNSLAFYYKFQLPWNKNWPHDGLRALLPMYAERLENNPEELGFGPWVIIDLEEEHVIGDIGFKGLPDEDGNIEVGYHIVASERNFGFASEAVDALCQWAFRQENVKGIEAQCDKGNIPSQKVLINNGFNHTGRSQDILVFKKDKTPKDHKQNTFHEGI